MKKRLIVDALSMVPYYDYYLINNLIIKNSNCYSFCTTFFRDKEIVKKINNPVNKLDIIYKTRFGKYKFGKAIKAFEYIINMMVITNSVRLDKIELVHIQWLPLIELLGFKSLEIKFLEFWKSRGVKIIYTAHNILPHDSGKKYYETYSKVYKLCDQLICHTNKTALELEDKFKIESQKINVIPHGPLFDNIQNINQNEARKKLNLPDKKTVLILGFLRPYKGIEFLLKSWKKLTSEINEPLNLIIAGEGKKEYKSKILKYIEELGVENSVTTKFQFIDADDVAAYHFAADLVVFPYKDIDQSGALYSAMATKRPIVVTSVGGFKEVVQDGVNGYLINYGDTNELAKKMSIMLRDRHICRRFVEKNKELLDTKYSWDRIADETLKVYDKTKSRK